jgi:predicted transcriptional regulator
MEQNISFEIIDILLNKEIHTRALAKRLNINHMTTSRYLKELVNDNVLDFRMEGRNKMYFLKKNIESRNYATMTELYKLISGTKKNYKDNPA